MHSFYDRSTILPFSVSDVFSYLTRPTVFERLIPPWLPVEIVEKTSEPPPRDGSSVTIKLHKWLPSFKCTYQNFTPNSQYTYHLTASSPSSYSSYAFWKYVHTLYPTNESTHLTDSIVCSLFPKDRLHGKWSCSKAISHLIEHQLDRIFKYREQVLLHDLGFFTKWQKQTTSQRKIVLVGATGFLGSALIHFLLNQGIQVIRLVRKPSLYPYDYYWNPSLHEFPDSSLLESCDGWIILSGKSISEGNWDIAHKKEMLQSRLIPLQALLRKANTLTAPPKSILVATGIGIYKENTSNQYDENGPTGNEFLSSIAQQIEEILFTHPSQYDTRCVSLRISPVIDLRGGMLRKLLPVFRFFLGSSPGTGKEWLSWISLDDALTAITTAIFDSEIDGPINITSPFPLISSEFGKTIASVMQKPCWPPFPKCFFSTFLGTEKAHELLFTSHNIFPKKLHDRDFQWSYPTLESCLRYTLGKEPMETNN